MACCMPLKGRNLKVNTLTLKPTVVVVELVEALKHFTSWSVTFGCIHSAILQSIHGNRLLMVAKISSVADIIDNNFLEAYGGESKNGSLAATFSSGDTISISCLASSNHHDSSEVDLPYSILANFQSCFLTMDGATSGVCLKENYNNKTKGSNEYWILNFIVWESVESCYSYIMRSDMKYANVPYSKGRSLHLRMQNNEITMMKIKKDRADKELIMGIGAVSSSLMVVLFFKYVVEPPSIIVFFTLIMILIVILFRHKSSDKLYYK